jgi:putative transposase
MPTSASPTPFAEGFAYARNPLQTVPKAHQEMVAAALRSVFAQ